MQEPLCAVKGENKGDTCYVVNFKPGAVFLDLGKGEHEKETVEEPPPTPRAKGMGMCMLDQG